MYKYLINAIVVGLFLWIEGQTVGVQVLLPLDVSDNDRFGHSVSVDGSFLAAGAPKYDISDDEGAVYVYQYAGSGWSQFQDVLTAPTPTENANFGEALDIKGDILAVGAPGVEKAYVYAFNGSEWEHRVTISKPGTGAVWDNSEFGCSVAVSGSTIVIGARGYNNDQGCICIYEFDGDTTCTASSGNPFTATGSEDLGYSVAIDENTIVAGAPGTIVGGENNSGMIVIYDRPSAEGTWSHRQSIDLDSPVESEYFGRSVAISGPTIVVGAPERSVYPKSGIVYLYDRQMDLSWTLGPVITREPDSSENHDEFGHSVAIDGSKIVVGCSNDDIETTTLVGSVWVFDDVTSNITVDWDATPTFVHNYDESGDRLGSSVDVSGQLIAAGAPYKDRTSSSSNDGAVYTFKYLEKVINEFQVNTYTNDNQDYPAIASNTTGNYVTVWESKGQDGDWYGIFGQRYDENGIRLDSEFQVNVATAGFQQRADVAMVCNRNFIVVWEADDGPYLDICARLFDVNGNPLSNEILVNSYTDGLQEDPKVAVDANGNFVVVWTSDREEEGHERSICGRKFNSAGVPLSNEFVISQLKSSSCADITMAPNGDFAIAWHLKVLYGKRAVQLRLYNADTTPNTDVIDANTTDITVSTWPVVAYKDSSELIILWSAPAGNNIYGQRFDTDGNKIGPELILDESPFQAHRPSVAFYDDGRMVVAWQADESDGSSNVWAREYESDGLPSGLPFCVNRHTENDQGHPDITIVNSEQYAIVWRSNEQDGSDYGIFASIGPKTYLGDFNFDQRVNLTDFQILAEGWLNDEPVLDIAPEGGDGMVNLLDFSIFAEQLF